MPPGNRYQEKNVGRLELSTKIVSIDGTGDVGNNVELIAAPGAGSRLRVFGVVVTQAGTAKADVNIHFASGKSVLNAQVPNDSHPVTDKLNGNFVQGDTNEALQYDITDQALDDAEITVYYIVEVD